MLRGISVFGCAVVATTLVACGRRIDPDFKVIPRVPAVQAEGTNSFFDGIVGDPDQRKPLPCQVWLGAPDYTEQSGAQPFQLFSKLALNDGPHYGDPRFISGKFLVSDAPQFAFALSKEVAGAARTPVDPVTVEEFYELARQANQRGELDDGSWGVLRWMHWTGDTEGLIKYRNQAMVTGVEKKLPGIFTGKTGSLAESPLFLALIESAGLRGVRVEDYFERLTMLERRSPLFASRVWTERTNELLAQIQTLKLAAEAPVLNVTDRFCRFALVQKIQAQLLSIKGVTAAPATKLNGLLADYPTSDVATFATQDIGGIYPLVVTPQTLPKLLDNALESIPKGLDRQVDLQNYLRYILTLIYDRDPLIWQSPGEASSSPKINSALLKLGFGLAGLTLKQIVARDLSIGDRLTLKQDNSPWAHAQFLGTAMDMVEILDRVRDSTNAFDKILFDDATRERLVGDDASSLRSQVNRLLLGMTFEGLKRVGENDVSTELRYQLRRLGARLHVKRLIELPY